VDQTLVFETWQELHIASAETIKAIGTRLADAVIIAVHDHLHAEVMQAFADQGYHILCEKPMATSIKDCLAMEAAVRRSGIIFGVCHGDCPLLIFSCMLRVKLTDDGAVLRYSPYSRAITEIVQSGSLGKLVNIVQVEPVGYYHFAHSYVRGNWANEAASSFSLMTKCCQ
jgi:predicted dehydrogenase